MKNLDVNITDEQGLRSIEGCFKVFSGTYYIKGSIDTNMTTEIIHGFNTGFGMEWETVDISNPNMSIEVYLDDDRIENSKLERVIIKKLLES